MRTEQPSRKAPKTVLGSIIVVVILAVLVLLTRAPRESGRPASPPPSSTAIPSAAVSTEDVGEKTAIQAGNLDAQPSPRVDLSDTRREGTRYDCHVIGRIEGAMAQTTGLKVFHPVFEGTIKSRWIAPWSVHFTVDVLRNDGVFIEEKRKFEEVRCVELLVPANLTDLGYQLDPKLNTAIVALAGQLQSVLPEIPVSAASWALVKSQDFNFADIARLSGMDAKILDTQETSVNAAARILDAFEGKTVEVSLKDGRARWIYAPDLPRRVVDTLGRVNTLVDYSALPSPTLAVGETTNLSHLAINELLPPVLLDEILGDYDTFMELQLTRLQDRKTGGRAYAIFDGAGELVLQQADGNIYGRLGLDQASLWVDITEPDHRFLHKLELAAPVEADIMNRPSRFKEVSWEGDLRLHVLYQVDLK